MTRLIDAKAAAIQQAAEELQNVENHSTQVKAGRVLSNKNEASLKAAMDLLAQVSATIDEVLASVQASADAEVAKTEDPSSIEEKAGKVEERFRDPKVALALLQLAELE